MGVLSGLEPSKVYDYFEKICSVPHGSGNTGIISDMLVGFARELNLECRKDSLNNVVIFKPASKGLENLEPVILQGHMDMVCAKAPDCNKDMTAEGLDLCVDGDWIRAIGTSLGGDDGIAVAIALAVLSDDSLVHPPIEAVFTVDEETGMYGAAGIDLSDIKGRRMLNIDSEEDGVFTVSCAGGLRADCKLPASFEALKDEKTLIVTIKGLLGGHSGCEIDKGRANANKLMARILYEASAKFDGLRLCSINGGRFDNVICPECTAIVAVQPSSACHFAKFINDFAADLGEEYAAADPGLKISCAKYMGNDISEAYSAEATVGLLRTIFTLPQGVIEMSMDIKGLVQTSLNLGRIMNDKNSLMLTYSIRSCITSQKYMVLHIVKAIIEQAGGTVDVHGEYPGWKFNRDSAFRASLAQVYEDINGKQPSVSATHGGLECGLFIEKLPGLDCVSIGPDLRDIHSPEERMSISSVAKLYELVVKFLAKLGE